MAIGETLLRKSSPTLTMRDRHRTVTYKLDALCVSPCQLVRPRIDHCQKSLPHPDQQITTSKGNKTNRHLNEGVATARGLLVSQPLQ